MIHLILSLDYEIFGNGSGDVWRDMIEPTERLLSLCNRYGAKMSIMLEVGEYWAMQEAERNGSLRLDYSPSLEIKRQIQNAVKDGHDVQLHLHPWWIDATFENNKWRLHPEYMKITDLPNGLGSETDLHSVIGTLWKGKKTLESMLRPVRDDYECLVYRAAMFWGQPSRELIEGLKKAGLVADSSVVRGLHETKPVLTDYRDAPSTAGYWWTNADDIAQAGPTGKHIIEFPVYSTMKPYINNLKWTKLSVSLKRRSLERANKNGFGMMEARRSTEPMSHTLCKLGTLHPLKYDFCKLSARDMIRGLNRVIKFDSENENDFGTPLVMLGHSKDFWNDRNLELFLCYVRKQCGGRACFAALGELTKGILRGDTLC